MTRFLHFGFQVAIATAMAPLVHANGGNPDLVLHYTLNDAVGSSTLVDSSGNGFDASVLAFPTLGQPGATPSTGTSVEFDGLVSHGRTPDGPPLSTLTSDFTVTAWIHADAFGGFRRILGNDGAWAVGFVGNQMLLTTRGIQDYPISAPLTAGTWHHVAYAFDSNFDATFYLDGNLVGTVVGASASGTPDPEWTIGALQHAGGGLSEVFDGRIDDIQVYDCALPLVDIQELFQNPGQTLGGGTASYCTAKVNSLGCTPAIGFSGAPSVSGATPFHVTAAQVINNKAGILFYGLGSANIPFQGGILCVQPPIQRTGVQISGGNPPPNDCTGTYDFDFGSLIGLGADPSLVAGAAIFAQYWTRDAASPSTTGLTDGLSFVIGG